MTFDNISKIYDETCDTISDYLDLPLNTIFPTIILCTKGYDRIKKDISTYSLIWVGTDGIYDKRTRDITFYCYPFINIFENNITEQIISMEVMNYTINEECIYKILLMKELLCYFKLRKGLSSREFLNKKMAYSNIDTVENTFMRMLEMDLKLHIGRILSKYYNDNRRMMYMWYLLIYDDFRNTNNSQRVPYTYEYLLSKVNNKYDRL